MKNFLKWAPLAVVLVFRQIHEKYHAILQLFFGIHKIEGQTLIEFYTYPQKSWL